MLKTKSFTKIFSLFMGTPMYWFPDDSKYDEQKFIENFYTDENVHISYFHSTPIY